MSDVERLEDRLVAAEQARDRPRSTLVRDLERITTTVEATL